MIVELRAKNCYVFSEEIEFSMEADKNNKRFLSNVHTENSFNVLKVAGIYGPNNVGKTCLSKCIRAVRNLMLDKDTMLSKNIFSDSDICELGIRFLENGREFDYEFKFDVEKEEYLYEKFSEITPEKEVVYLIRDVINREFYCIDGGLEAMLSVISKKNIVAHLIDGDVFEHIKLMKDSMLSFASRIDILDMNNIPISKTIEILKNDTDPELQRKVVDFIKNADLDLEDYRYSNLYKSLSKKNQKKVVNKTPEEQVLDLPDRVMDRFNLTSVYKGIEVPSLLFDSTGTKKIASLASYIIQGIQEGRILIIDELDSSIHFKLTRAIVSMFNNELNKDAQMIFTVHDINLLDCRHLFRKEQIWFVHKDESGVYVYSLNNLSDEEREEDEDDLIENYRRGILGAIPEPEFINSLISMKGNEGSEED